MKVILLLDNVRYHHTKSVKGLLESLKNISLKYIPPYSSELNSIEHLWKDIRKNVTHNHLFESIAEVIKAIRKYFMTVQRCPTKIKRLCTYIS
jgi:transposase